MNLDGVAAVVVRVESDDDLLRLRRNKIDPDIISRERKAAAAAIDEHGEFDFGGATVIEQFVEGGFHGAAGEKDVIDKDDRRAVDIARDLRRGEFLRDRMTTDIVPMKGDVHRASAGIQPLRQPPREFDPAVGDAQKQESARPGMPGGNGVGEPQNRGLNFAGTNGLRFGHRASL